jgi:DUF971 family protein
MMKLRKEANPTSITADRKQAQLTVIWTDGHTSIYPFDLLRAACPCAGCRGGHEHMSAEPDPAVFDVAYPDSAKTHMRSIEGVGSYAITIDWEDGHHYGIYNWHYLKALCPCSECRRERQHAG